MSRLVQFSESKKGFKPHTSLKDEPFLFNTDRIRGAIHYIPLEKQGGDTFIVQADDNFAISLVGDMTGHGEEGRQKIHPFLQDLEKINQTAAAPYLRRKHLLDLTIGLDKRIRQIGFDFCIALSLVRISSGGTTHFFNYGENLIFYTEKNKSFDVSGELSFTKIGLLGFTSENEENIKITPHKVKLKSKDKILICTDGVIGPENDRDDYNAKTNISHILVKNSSIENIIKGIGNYTHDKLQKLGTTLEDDYTIIGLELK